MIQSNSTVITPPPTDAVKLTPNDAAGEPGFSLGGLLKSGQLPLDTPAGRALSFLLVVVQCLAVYWVIRRFRIENDLFRLIVPMAMGGFIIHHFLPLRFRLPFFLALSSGFIFYCVGLDRGEWHWLDSVQRGGALFAIGVAIIAICRLPIRFHYRVGALLGAAVALAFFRSGWVKWEPLDAVWPILGAMFMYRTACYIYDIEHERTKSTWVHALSYFFLFPALWLFVFPLIDFKTFVREHFKGQPTRIYQRGLQWMMRGIIQLLLWRLIYFQMYIDPARIANGTELAQFVLANIGLYLRVSGQFHFAIGILHLFGFALPETNRNYFLASDFVDYWRRANIYMKDFLMKLVYYPLVLRFKRLGPTGSVIASIAGVFGLTWFLHPYQTFWIAGSFPLGAKDAVFWGLLCLGVMASSLRELNAPRRNRTAPSWNESLMVAGRAGLTFVLISVLWSIWSADDLTQWWSIWSLADFSTLAIGLASFIIIAGGRLALDRRGQSAAGAPAVSAPALPIRWAIVSCLVPAAALVAASSDFVFDRLDERQRIVAQSFFSNTPNKSGEEFLARGYYENIMDVARVSPMLDGALSRQPSNWQLLEETPAVRETVDLRTRELVPLTQLTINRVPFSTNRWAMRDQDYAQLAPAGATRVALLGSSITMGWNVPKEQTFEALVEQSLNSGPDSLNVEILNFAVNGYSIVSVVEHLEHQVLPFAPHVVAVVGHPEDPGRAVYMLAKSLAMGYQPTDEYLRALLTKADINENDPRNWIERKLAPFGEDLTRWSYQRIVSIARANGAEPWLIYLPGVLQTSIGELDSGLVAMADKAGFRTIPLFDVYSATLDRSALMVAPWDAHPNADGHRLVAAALEPQLRPLILSLRATARK